MAEYQPPIPDLDAVDEVVFWTRRRVIYAVIAIIVIITFLTLILWPALALWLNPPAPPPPTRALPRV